MDEDLTVQIEFFKKSRESIFAQLQKVYDSSSKVAPGCVSNFLAKCNELDKLRSKFELVQDNILRLNICVEKEDALDIDNVQTSFDDLFFNIRTVEQDLKARMITNVATTPAPQVSVRLPKLDVPTWSGDLAQFQNFFALFNTLVHEGNYPGVVKLAYLRKSLLGPPLALIQNLELNDANYVIAYNLIQSRYEDPRALAAFYVNQILDFQTLKSASLQDLQSFLNIFNTNVQAFNKLNLGESSDHGDFLLFQCALRALPTNVRGLFERSLGNRAEIPSFDNLIKFVETQCKIEELTRRSSTTAFQPSSTKSPATFTKAPFKGTQSLLVTPPVETPTSPIPQPPNQSLSISVCPFCDERPKTHPLHSCSKYAPLSLDQKYEILKKLYRCFKCLGSHSRKSCKSQGRCIHCNSPSHHNLFTRPVESSWFWFSLLSSSCCCLYHCCSFLQFAPFHVNSNCSLWCICFTYSFSHCFIGHRSSSHS